MWECKSPMNSHSTYLQMSISKRVKTGDIEDIGIVTVGDCLYINGDPQRYMLVKFNIHETKMAKGGV